MSSNTGINWDELKTRTWHIDEIITTYPHITGQKVASVNDMVIDWSVGLYRVSAIATDGTNIATLELKYRFTDSTLLDPANGSIISALSMYMPNSATRSMYDKDVYPYTITTDPRYVTRGVEADSVRVFKGTDTTATGTIISGIYDASNNLITDVIPLVEVVTGEPRIKRPPVFSTLTELVSEDIITYVFYDAVGRKVGTQPFLVSDSGAIFDYASGAAAITGIELRGDLIDANDSRTIQNQLNSPFQTALLEAWLTYNDGTEIQVPIDGNKCVLDGVGSFNTSLLGKPKNVTLHYYPSPGEPVINMGGGVKNHVSKSYLLANIPVDTSFALKLFMIPEWDAGNTTYNYRYFMTSLAGDVDAEVTNFVTARIDGGSSVPGTNHGNEMNVTLGINLDTVMPGAYPGHYHTQSLKLTTEIPGSVGFHPYVIDYIGDGSFVYGHDVVAHVSTVGDGEVNIGRDFPSITAMLGELYEKTAPLYDNTVTVTPPVPTHAEIMYGGSVYEIELATQWDQDISMPSGWPNMVQGDTLIIKWFVRDGSNEYVLSFSPLLIVNDL